MERLQKFMAHAGVASRRQCEQLIREGKVKVNGRVVTELGTKVNPATDIVEVGGKLLSGSEKKVYLLLNKPSGVVTTVKDPRGRKTVMDLIRHVPQRVYPVGRLDYDTDGLLLLTNDGQLANALLHPRHQVEKTYLALVRKVPSREKLEQLAAGIQLNDGLTAPAKVRLVKTVKGNGLVEITIHEGRNRQVRRMAAAIGHPVLKLRRTKMAFLTLGNLKPGQFRYLTSWEVKRLKQIARSC